MGALRQSSPPATLHSIREAKSARRGFRPIVTPLAVRLRALKLVPAGPHSRGHMTRRILFIALLLATACQSSAPTPVESPDSGSGLPDGGGVGPDGGGILADAGTGAAICPSDSPIGAVNGRLVVRTGIIPGSDYFQVRVLLGDGTRFDLPVDDAGVAVFSDPSLTGPQTVTRVALRHELVADANPPVIADVETIAGVDLSTLCFVEALETDSPAQTFGAISGQVSGGAPGAQVDVWVTMGGSPTWYWAEGASTAGADGGYSLIPRGWGGAPAALIASDSTTGKLGLRPFTPSTSPMSGQDIVLDHSESEQLSVTVQGAQPYVPVGSATYPSGALTYLYGGMPIEFGNAAHLASGQVPRIPATGSFASVEQLLVVKASPDDVVTVPVTSSVATVSFPSLPQVTYPDYSDGGTLATGVPAAGLHVDWSADPQSQQVWLTLRDSDTRLNWDVYTRAADGHFDVFPLPADASPNQFAPGSAVNIWVRQRRAADRSAFEDWFNRAPLRTETTASSFSTQAVRTAQLQ